MPTNIRGISLSGNEERKDVFWKKCEINLFMVFGIASGTAVVLKESG